MKFKAFLFVVALFAFASATSAQKLGGWKEVDTTNEGVQKAAEFAVGKKNSKLIEVLKAESQSVAGMNYRMCLKVQSPGEKDEADAVITVEALVFASLRRTYELKSWTEKECGDDDDDGGLLFLLY
ncbi:MAG: hypothetical protein JO053_02510 [Acidobacteria bacterium]|nr:hypothetical protein [Acidobacteriota bacterium]